MSLVTMKNLTMADEMFSSQDFMWQISLVSNFLLLGLVLLQTFILYKLRYHKSEMLEAVLWRKISKLFAGTMAKKDEEYLRLEEELFHKLLKNMEGIINYLHRIDLELALCKRGILGIQEQFDNGQKELMDLLKGQNKNQGSPQHNVCYGCGSLTHWIRNCPYLSSTGRPSNAQQRCQQRGSYPKKC